MKKVLMALPFIFGAVLVLYFAVRVNKENYAVVKEEEVKTLVYGSGYAKAENYVVVRAEVSGYIKEVFVKEGDFVRKGQPLTTIDSKTIDASIKEVSERINLVRERLREGSPYLKSLESGIESARINMENSKSLFERRERLFSQGLIPKEAYEQSKTQYEVSRREYERLKSNYQDVIVSLRSEERVLLAEREKLLREKEKYVIRSPVEGYVLKKFVNPGDYINHMSQENRLFSVGSKGWEVWLEVDEEYAGMLREGQRVILRVDAYPNERFEGKVLQVIREVDRNRKLITVKVYAELPEGLPNGSTVDGQIEVESKKAVLIPASAYQDGHVLLYDGVRRVKVPVKVGRRYGEYLEVLEGLKPGDKVVMP
ncbi:efflux RND transporter periplasmic adaptor subunit [Hydrogenobacter sp. T-2]|uniref:efflux RND transporter periplasmic adaptor subunit n=1 Tax=Pampinifervens diazotrophicum TaxID=1632018 RepID=UPI002B261AC2|nr:efflux RND transporter periplasmic adaptor subunit [Hydrogenobacter sp. T-2]WPM32185.1 efflux RND transporter periplasmic adaptor subunit [Hydrogenobacter sp. T-2]